jgi:opacity protein-like surface antigen
LYGTGGAAFSDPKTTINCPGPAAANSWCSAPESGSLSPERVGFTVGGGVEQMFWNNWTVRADYRFDRFEDKNLIFFPGAGVAGSDLIAVRSKVYTNTFDVGGPFCHSEYGATTTPPSDTLAFRPRGRPSGDFDPRLRSYRSP